MTPSFPRRRSSALGRDVGVHKRPRFAGAGIHRLQDPAFLLDGLARGYHVDSFIKTLGCLWNDLALFDQLRDPPLDAIGRDTFLAQVDRGLNYVGRFEHRLALTQNTNGAGSGILGARGSRRPRELGEPGIDERIVRAAPIVDQTVAAVTNH